MNLPNGLTIARIAVTPLIAALPIADSWTLRLTAFALFAAAGITDYIDGRLARSRQQETDLGRLLDPLADKLLLLATFIPMFWLMGSGVSPSLLASDGTPSLPSGPGIMAHAEWGRPSFPFLTPMGAIALPWWVVAIVLGRELFMTIFRHAAARRGVVIAAIGPAKWKTGFQLVWQGSAYFWFWSATLAAERQWTTTAWRGFAYFNGLVGVVTMLGAMVLTSYSLWLYVRNYGSMFVTRTARG